MLAVDVDECSGKGFEFGAGNVLVVRPGFTAAVTQAAADVDLSGVIGVVEGIFCQGLTDGGAEVGKGGADGCAFCTVADVADVGALAEDEAEGVNEDAFARAGFAGEDVVAGAEADVAVGDDGDLVDGELFEHEGSGVGKRVVIPLGVIWAGCLRGRRPSSVWRASGPGSGSRRGAARAGGCRSGW